MRRERRDQFEQCFKNLAWHRWLFFYCIQNDHHCANGGVQPKCFNILRNFLYRLMHQTFEGMGGDFIRDSGEIGYIILVHCNAPNAIQEAVYTHNTFRIPRLHRLEWAEEHVICAEAISAILRKEFVGIHHVTERFRHFTACLAKYDSLMNHPSEWLRC